MTDYPQVVAVGHAIVDVLASCEDAEVAGLGLAKGTMALVDDGRAEAIYSAMGPAIEASGGSAANTAASLASLGARVAFVGKVAEDGLGKVFAHDIRSIGVHFDVAPAPVPSPDAPGTGRCLVLVTPDAEKTMCTNLGVGAYLQPADVDAALLGGARVVYLEGYLCGKEESAAGVEEAITVARRSGTQVAFSASDPGWVDLYTEELRALLDRVDILFANEPEALGLSGCDDLDAAVAALAARCPTVAVTLGAAGCVVVHEGSRLTVPAARVDRVVDTTGAGDSFAAGFLYGVVNDLGPEVSARLGGLAAAEVVAHMGARPQADLAALAAAAGLI